MSSRYIRLLRPIAWICFLLPFSMGYGLGINVTIDPYQIILAFLAFFCWMGFSFIVNAIGDIDVDKFHNGRAKDMDLANQPLVTKEITKKEALFISVIFFIFSLIFSWFVHLYFFILIFIVDIIGYIYSMEPFRFKTKPIADILCNAFAAVFIFIAGLSIGGDNMNIMMILGIFIMIVIFYIPTVVTDYEFDKKAGLKTSAIFFGPKKILRAMYPLTVILIITMLIVILTSKIELKLLAFILIIYSLVFTLISNIRLKNNRLYLHQNWILVPFAIISIAFCIYGIIKLFG